MATVKDQVYMYCKDNERLFKNLSKNQIAKKVVRDLGVPYNTSVKYVQEYYKNILNVDYNNITIENFVKGFDKLTTYEVNQSDLEDYVEYVKKNKIKLEGKATPLLPIIYNNV